MSTPTLRLSLNQILRIDGQDGIAEISIVHGVLWATETPAHRDILLRAGDRLQPVGGWPILLQALEDAEVCLLPSVSFAGADVIDING